MQNIDTVNAAAGIYLCLVALSINGGLSVISQRQIGCPLVNRRYSFSSNVWATFYKSALYQMHALCNHLLPTLYWPSIQVTPWRHSEGWSECCIGGRAPCLMLGNESTSIVVDLPEHAVPCLWIPLVHPLQVQATLLRTKEQQSAPWLWPLQAWIR